MSSRNCSIRSISAARRHAVAALLTVVGALFATAVVPVQAEEPSSEKTLPIKIYFDQHIRMRDGIELAADVYRPDVSGKYDCILNRTPYLKNGESALEFGRYFAQHGYAFVAEDVRGRGDSQGTFVPYRAEGRDGYDSVEWCAAQPWSTGRVGTIGGSYNGKTQWLTAVEQPPHLVTMIALTSPSDPFVEWPTGEPIPMDISWYFYTSGHVVQNDQAVDWEPLLRHLPKGDPFARNNQKLVMGPWPHSVNSKSKLGDVDFGESAVIDIKSLMLRWYDAWLKATDNGIKAGPPVHIFLMGSNKWVDEKAWPIPDTRYTDFYLHSAGRANSLFGDGKLSLASPQTEGTDSFTYDPADPAPFITDPSFEQVGGPDDYRAVERRDDVLVYTTEPVSADTEICGPIRMTLYASTTATDTDFTAKLVDVWPSGFAQRLTDGFVRARFRNGMDKEALIEPGRIYEYNIDAWNTCQMFMAGHRIRLEVSSSAFPKYPRNLNTGEALGKSSRMLTAQQRIYHDEKHPSHVVLPLVPLRK